MLMSLTSLFHLFDLFSVLMDYLLDSYIFLSDGI